MQTLTIPYSGRLLLTHLATYGLASALDAHGLSAFVGHDPEALELTPRLYTSASTDEVCACIRKSAMQCERPVEADLEPGKTGNERIPVIRARATDPERAIVALNMRERLLEELERDSGRLAAGLIAGLGAPAPWIRDGKHIRPHHGASDLDGVPLNYTADIVRSALRHALQTAKNVTDADIVNLCNDGVAPPETEDKLGWTPPGTHVDWLHQWLAALGLCVLPVGLQATARARIPGFWRGPGARGITLPVLTQPISVPRLRAILQLPYLASSVSPSSARRLRALGISELVTFTVLDRSTPQMVQFSFGRGTRVAL